MANKTVIEQSNKVKASHLKELFTQIDSGSIGGTQLQAFLEHRNPFPWFEYLGDYHFGVHKEMDEFLSFPMSDRQYSTDLYAHEILEKGNLTFSREKMICPLIRTTLSHFGFNEYSLSYENILKCIIGSTVKHLGKMYTIELCPDETSMILAIQGCTRFKETLQSFTRDKLLVISRPFQFNWGKHKKQGFLRIGVRADSEDQLLHLDYSSSILSNKEWLVFRLKEV